MSYRLQVKDDEGSLVAESEFSCSGDSQTYGYGEQGYGEYGYGG